MIKPVTEVRKFLDKLASEPGAYRVRLTPDGILRFDGSRPFELSDFFILHEGVLYGRKGMTWLPSSPLPEKEVALCAFSMRRFALLKGDGTLDIASGKKVLDKSAAFLLFAKLPGKLVLIVADGNICGEPLRITPIRDHFGEVLASVIVREFVRKVLPEQLPVLETSLSGGDFL